MAADVLTALFGELLRPVDATRNPEPIRRTRSRRRRASSTGRIPGARVGSGQLSRRNGGSARSGGVQRAIARRDSAPSSHDTFADMTVTSAQTADTRTENSRQEARRPGRTAEGDRDGGAERRPAPAMVEAAGVADGPRGMIRVTAAVEPACHRDSRYPGCRRRVISQDLERSP